MSSIKGEGERGTETRGRGRQIGTQKDRQNQRDSQIYRENEGGKTNTPTANKT